MAEAEPPPIEILIKDEDYVLHPGDTLSGGWRFKRPQPVYAEKAEMSVLWYTEGRGTEDMGVAYHEIVAENRQLSDSDAFPFHVTLPVAPWSYQGKAIKIQWALRVRVYPKEGDELAAEQRFWLLPEGRPRPDLAAPDSDAGDEAGDETESASEKTFGENG